MNVVAFNGTKVDFVVEFYEVLSKLNETSPNPATPIIGYPMTNALFLGSLQGEPNLVRQYSNQPTPIGGDVVDLENTKKHFLHSTGLGDGQEELDKITTLTKYSPSKTKVKALAHDFGVAEESQGEAVAHIESILQHYSINRTSHTPDPTTRIQDDIFHKLPPRNVGIP